MKRLFLRGTILACGLCALLAMGAAAEENSGPLTWDGQDFAIMTANGFLKVQEETLVLDGEEKTVMVHYVTPDSLCSIEPLADFDGSVGYLMAPYALRDDGTYEFDSARYPQGTIELLGDGKITMGGVQGPGAPEAVRPGHPTAFRFGDNQVNSMVDGVPDFGITFYDDGTVYKLECYIYSADARRSIGIISYYFKITEAVTYNQSDMEVKGYIMGEGEVEGALVVEFTNRTDGVDAGGVFYMLAGLYDDLTPVVSYVAHADESKFYPMEAAAINYRLSPGESVTIYIPIMYGIRDQKMAGTQIGKNWHDIEGNSEATILMARADSVEEYEANIQYINANSYHMWSNSAKGIDMRCNFVKFGFDLRFQTALYQLFGSMLPR